jgi:hypothetical protein
MVMHEEEIRAKVNQLRGWIEQDRRQNNDVYELEVEHCYLSEEMQVRQARKHAHEEYLFNNPRLFDEN